MKGLKRCAGSETRTRTVNNNRRILSPLLVKQSKVITAQLPYVCPNGDTNGINLHQEKQQWQPQLLYCSININGKRHRKLLGYDKKTAQTQLSRIEYELKFQPLTTPEEDVISIQYAFRLFARDVELSGICKRQLEATVRSIRRLKSSLTSSNIFNIIDITELYLKHFIAARSKDGVTTKYNSKVDSFCPTISITTLNKDIQNIKRFFKFCCDMKWIKENPSSVLKFFNQKEKKERYFFSGEETAKILSCSGKFHDFYYLLLHTGIRATDTYKLSPGNFKDRWLSVVMNKTGDRLEIPLKEDILELLEPRVHQELIYPETKSERRRRNCVKTVQRLFPVDFVRSNNINLHTFRHTYAHTMLNRGVPKEVLQTLLGHRSIKTTEIYANWVRKEELEKWV